MPLGDEEKRKAASLMGQATSTKKAEASRKNGKLGGKPPKPLEGFECICADPTNGHKSICPRGRAIKRKQEPTIGKE